MQMSWGKLSKGEWVNYFFLNMTSSVPKSVHRKVFMIFTQLNKEDCYCFFWSLFSSSGRLLVGCFLGGIELLA
jgi:hypothetical protein